MAKRQHRDSVVETAVERHMTQRDPRELVKFLRSEMERGNDAAQEEEDALSDKVTSILARTLKIGDKIYLGRRGGRVRFKTVRTVVPTRKNERLIVNDEWVYDFMVGRVLVMA